MGSSTDSMRRDRPLRSPAAALLRRPMNDRLVYFGSTVNIASRLEHLTSGGDVVVSETICQDAEVTGFLERNKASALGRSAQTTLRDSTESAFRSEGSPPPTSTNCFSPRRPFRQKT